MLTSSQAQPRMSDTDKVKGSIQHTDKDFLKSYVIFKLRSRMEMVYFTSIISYNQQHLRTFIEQKCRTLPHCILSSPLSLPCILIDLHL